MLVKQRYQFFNTTTLTLAVLTMWGTGLFGNSPHLIPAAGIGSLKWKFKTGGGSYSSPFIAEGVLYWGSSDNFLYALR